MRGTARTRPTDDVALIFWHIRTTRDARTRRSWQRRARIALAARDDLTPAERHEVIAVWSRLDCDRYDSAALRKVTGQPAPLRHERRPARAAMRAAFDETGQRRAPRAPRASSAPAARIASGLSRARGPAANDQTFSLDAY